MATSPFIYATKVTPYWLRLAYTYDGLREFPGKRHNSIIIKWWKLIKAHYRDDETPWCAAFVGGVLEACGIVSSRSAAARSYTQWGVRLGAPAVGAIVVLWRGSPTSRAGHVGFVVGKDEAGNLLVLGGNQSNQVNVKPFAMERVLSYHWPSCQPEPLAANLPVVAHSAALSNNEA